MPYVAVGDLCAGVQSTWGACAHSCICRGTVADVVVFSIRSACFILLGALI